MRSIFSCSSPRPHRPHGPEQEALAQAGLDLFLAGFVHDGVNRSKREARHPGTVPNLSRIPEHAAMTRDDSLESQIIVVIGGPVEDDHTPSHCLKQRISTALRLFQRISARFQQRRVEAYCYFVPTGGIMEAEVIRNQLTQAGVPPHQIVMDCIYTNTIDNAMKLMPILQHLNVHMVHLVTSEFHMTRAKTIFDGILGASKEEYKIRYHVAPDGMTEQERAAWEAEEQAFVVGCRPRLEAAIAKVKSGRCGPTHVGSQV